MKQHNSKIVEKSKQMPQEVVTFQDNFRLYQQERSQQSSLSLPVMLTTGLESYNEKNLLESVWKGLNVLEMTISAQSNFVKCLCLMVHSCQNKEAEKESEPDVNMTEVPLVYGPLRSFIDMDLQVDLKLACLSHMSVNIIFVPNVKINPVLLEFISTLMNLQKDKN
jgi:hypothetical protein